MHIRRPDKDMCSPTAESPQTLSPQGSRKDSDLTQQGRLQSPGSREASRPQGGLKQVSGSEPCVSEHLRMQARGGVCFPLVLSSCFNWRLRGRLQTADSGVRAEVAARHQFAQQTKGSVGTEQTPTVDYSSLS